MNPVRVVVADDSALFRSVLRDALRSIPDVEVVAEVANGREAITAVRDVHPDLLTLDLEMPVLDGLGTLAELKAQRLVVDVVVVSAHSTEGARVTLDALRLGALDFVTKSAAGSAVASREQLLAQLRPQVAVVRLRQAARGSVLERVSIPVAPPAIRVRPELVVIGASTGGPAALSELIPALAADFPLPVLIVQHMPETFTAGLADSLARKGRLRAVEARHGELVRPGVVYLAPGGKHMKLETAFDGKRRLVITDEPPERHCKPSVDYLFRSVAAECGGAVLGVILTGMGDDGVRGLQALKQRGAYVLAQDESSCVVFGMPKEAIRAGVVDAVLPLAQLAQKLGEVAVR